jgi:sulfoxide reductase catalytic subunit YedY
MSKIPSSQITPEHVYWSSRVKKINRRTFLAGGMMTGGALIAACSTSPTPAPTAIPQSSGEVLGPQLPAGLRDELGDEATKYDSIINYNNFYEFTTDKQAVAPMSARFKPTTWSVTIGGLVNKPMTLDLDDIRKRFSATERIYRLRCVEAWSMVIPWNGFSLSEIIKLVEPKSEAKYVRFETLFDTAQFPGQKDRTYTWPYVEGLRMDEAMNELTTMATGLYGRDLPPQSGAPIRLVVPWKYGFKSIKSIHKIDFVAEQPRSLWMNAAPNEYGFYSNVNPSVSHPRWSQASERRIGEVSRRRTLMFNGYEAQVTNLYAGMDLRQNY